MRRAQAELPLKKRYPPGVPRANLERGSAEWCYMTVDYARSLYRSYETSLEEWNKILEELDEVRAYERIPEGRPYGDLTTLLQAEIGATVEQSRTAVASRAAHPLGIGNHPGRCIANNVINAPTKQGNSGDYLTARIARDRPDILERMRAGEFRSVRAAAREAGLVRATATIYIDSPEAAAHSIGRLFKGAQRAALIAALSEGLGG